MPSDPGTGINSMGRAVLSIETVLPWSAARE
jgi:hypothetical protein